MCPVETTRNPPECGADQGCREEGKSPHRESGDGRRCRNLEGAVGGESGHVDISAGVHGDVYGLNALHSIRPSRLDNPCKVSFPKVIHAHSLPHLAATMQRSCCLRGRGTAAYKLVRYSVRNQAFSVKNFDPSKSASCRNMPRMAWSSFRITATSACIGFFPFAKSFS